MLSLVILVLAIVVGVLVIMGQRASQQAVLDLTKDRSICIVPTTPPAPTTTLEGPP